MGFAPAPFYCFEFDGESEFDVDLEFDAEPTESKQGIALTRFLHRILYCILHSPARSLLLQSIQQRKRKYDSTPNVFKYC
jgi:hypothetical protein